LVVSCPLPYEVLIKIDFVAPNAFFVWVQRGTYAKLTLTKELSDWLGEMTIGLHHFDVAYRFEVDQDGNPYAELYFIILFEYGQDAMAFKLAWA
jgi:hypothetical protein